MGMGKTKKDATSLPKNLPAELHEDWPRICLLHAMVTNDMHLPEEIQRGDPVLLIGTEGYHDATLCQFDRYDVDRNYFHTPFKIMFKPVCAKSPQKNISQATCLDADYDSRMPARARTLVTEMDLVQETLGRIGVYEHYWMQAKREFEEAIIKTKKTSR